MMPPEPARELPMAFMPSPNDSLPPLASSSSFGSHTTTPTAIPDREQVKSASTVPSILTGASTSPGFGNEPSLVDRWRSFSEKQRESFETERNLWNMERELLTSQLTQLQNDLLIATSKLRQLELKSSGSNGSHDASALVRTSSGNSPRTLPTLPARGSSLGKQSVSMQQSRKKKPWEMCENSLDEKNLLKIGDTGTAIESSGSVQNDRSAWRLETPIIGEIISEEMPLSPPTSAAILSPPPESYRRHAGHTPGQVSVKYLAESPGTQTPKASAFPLGSLVAQNDGLDDDPCLKGPLALGPKPEHTLDVLQTLDEKLQDVKDHPEQLTPAVLQGAPGSDSSDSISEADVVERDTSDEAARSQPAPAQFVVDGPRLRLKASLNFGAPLGSLRPTHPQH